MRVMRRHYWLATALGALFVVAACTPAPSGGGGGAPANLPPTAVISGGPFAGSPPLTVSLSGSGSSDSDGTIDEYEWNFGDGSPTETGANVSHDYAAGNWTATLIVTDDDGATDVDEVDITVSAIDADLDGYDVSTDCNDSDPAINPGAADPTGDNVDQNCDGVDGVNDDSVFVRASGVDDSTCGTINDPCATISQGQTRALAQSRSFVLVAGGAYPKFSVQNGLEIRGGYGQNFKRPGQIPAPTAPTTTTVNAAFDASLGGPVAIIADGISTTTKVADLTAQGTSAAAGQASYAVWINNSTSDLTLDTVKINGGTAGVGAVGGNGSNATQTPAATGNPGENSQEGFTFCSTDRKNGGGAVGSGARLGGAGGNGGSQDSTCPCVFGSCWDARAGLAGNSGGGGAGGGGGGSAAGSGNAGNGGPGTPGAVIDGSGGGAGTASSGTVNASGLWAASGGTGGTGSLGQDGRGGGGGGGGGGSDEGTDDQGGGGGGGGQGGVRASAAGTGGTTGAASVALLINDSSPTLVGVQITLGTGGQGGAGGQGGIGQPGGSGGQGGEALCNNDTGYSGYPFGDCPNSGNGGGGGNGGAGGRGGHAGAGGGGAGGPAFGMVTSSSTPSQTGTTYSGGIGGAGGSGGANGVAGTAGQTGLVQNTIAL